MKPIPDAPLLEVDGLRTYFDTLAGTVRSVDGVSYTVHAGQTLGVVGESGCGKSVTALSILRLVPRPPGRFAGGARALSRHRPAEAVRGSDARHPRQPHLDDLPGADDLAQPGVDGGPADRRDRAAAPEGEPGRRRMERAVEMLRVVQIPEPERRANEYPHQLSGGMRQRVMIASALACNPELLIADEPTTALDVTIQAQILDLLKRLQKEFGMGVVMITHDLGVVAESCDRVVVMYAGRKVEEADVTDLFDRPLHPYTRALMLSMPAMNTRSRRLAEIPGMVPAPTELGRGCAFAARCGYANDRCRAQAPGLTTQGAGHTVACFAVEENRLPAREEALA